MKIGVLGGTGGVGTPFLKLALERGHSLVVLARTPSKLEPIPDHMTVVQGDSTIAQDVQKVCDGVDLVVSMVGNPKKPIVEDTIKNIVACAPKRVIGITSLGMGGSAPFVKFVLGLIVGKPNIVDCEAADKLLLDYGSKAVTVRPTGLADGPGAGKYEATKKTGMRFKPLKKADVALFLADILEDSTWDGGAVQLYAAA